MPRVLVVDDELGVQESIRMLLKDECEVATAAGVDEALTELSHAAADLILLDLVMPGRSGLDLLAQLAERGSHPPVIVLTATKTVATAVEAMKLGAADYVTKPFEIDALRIKIRQLLERSRLEEEVVRLRSEVDRRTRLGALLGRSDAMQELFRTLERVAVSRASVLVRGESGTGKELVARALHELSPRQDGPFIPVHCAAIPETLIESELFGHERGAFTDARDRRIGKFEQASGGTLFLDEIGELSPTVQVKLLRVLQEHKIERVGGNGWMDVDVRVLAATHRDLEADIESGRFRADLYYRINVVSLELPPLRERREDVRLLCEAFLARAREAAGRGPSRIASDARAALERYAWPGNVRELENAIERGVALAEGDVLELCDLPPSIVGSARMSGLSEQVHSGELRFEDAVEQYEKELLREALERAGWNQTRAAERIGLTRRTLKLKMDRYHLEPTS